MTTELVYQLRWKGEVVDEFDTSEEALATAEHYRNYEGFSPSVYVAEVEVV